MDGKWIARICVFIETPLGLPTNRIVWIGNEVFYLEEKEEEV